MKIILAIDYRSDVIKAFSGYRAFKKWMNKENLRFLTYTYQNEVRTSEYSLVLKDAKEDDEPEYSVRYDIEVLTSNDV